MVHANLVGAHAAIVGYQDARGTGSLGVAHFLYECTSTTIEHENKGWFPRFHSSMLVQGTFGKALAFVEVTAASCIGKVHLLRNGGPVRGNPKQSIAMIVSVGFRQVVRDLYGTKAKKRKRRG